MNKLVNGKAGGLTLMCLLLAALLMLASCSGSGAEIDNLQPQAPGSDFASGSAVEFPAGLPVDALMPWEELSSEGYATDAGRGTSAVNEDSLFTEGVDSFELGGSTAASGRALAVSTGSIGSGQLSYAVYRMPLVGETPSLVSLDVNLAAKSNGVRSEYFVAIADYGNGRWQHHGPFSDSHVRIPVEQGGDFVSSLGNLFVAVLAWDGSGFDIVGVGANTAVPGDTTAPPAPGAPQLTPVSGGLLLEWLPVAAADIAGYRIYHRNGSFIDQLATGVKSVPYIEGVGRHLLSGLSSQTFVRISAVDTSGNESALSPIVSATPLSGSAGTVLLETDATNVQIEDTVTLTASGAEVYDFDFDGDGDYDVTGDTSGTVLAYTSGLGVIRPSVRGTSSNGEVVALGGVSLIVAANIPPVAILSADALEARIFDGDANPASINFDASGSYDQDGGNLEFAFDLNGDGSLGGYNTNPLRTGSYSDKGVYYVGLSVRDEDGLVDQSAVAVSIYQLSDFELGMVASGSAYGANQYYSLAEVDGHPAIAYHNTNTNSGLYYVRALDSQGKAWGQPILLDDTNTGSTGYYAKLAVIAGNPAIVYVDQNDAEMRYIRSGTSTGQNLSHWTNAPVDIEDNISMSSYNIELMSVAGQPAVLYSEGNTLYYQRANGAGGTGNSAADWTAAPLGISIAPGSISSDVALSVAGGNPCAAYIYNSEIQYLRATSPSGASALDWPAVTIKVSGTRLASQNLAMEIVQGNPAIAFYDTTSSSSISYLRSTTAQGDLVANWPSAVTVYDGSMNGSNGYVNMVVIGGLPVVSHYTSGPGFSAVRVQQAEDSLGSSWGAPRVAAGASNFGVSSYNELASIDGLPGVITAYNSSMVYSSPKPEL